MPHRVIEMVRADVRRRARGPLPDGLRAASKSTSRLRSPRFYEPPHAQALADMAHAYHRKILYGVRRAEP